MLGMIYASEKKSAGNTLHWHSNVPRNCAPAIQATIHRNECIKTDRS